MELKGRCSVSDELCLSLFSLKPLYKLQSPASQQSRYPRLVFWINQAQMEYFALLLILFIYWTLCKLVFGVFIHSLVFSPRGQSGRSQSLVMEPIWLLAHCILGKFLGVVCHCFPPPLDVPTFATTCLCVCSDARDPSSEKWNCGRERCPVVILPKFRLPRKFREAREVC